MRNVSEIERVPLGPVRRARPLIGDMSPWRCARPLIGVLGATKGVSESDATGKSDGGSFSSFSELGNAPWEVFRIDSDGGLYSFLALGNGSVGLIQVSSFFRNRWAPFKKLLRQGIQLRASCWLMTIGSLSNSSPPWESRDTALDDGFLEGSMVAIG